MPSPPEATQDSLTSKYLYLQLGASAISTMRSLWLHTIAALISPVLVMATPGMFVFTAGGDDKPPKDRGCLRSCFNDKPTCPQGMEAKQLGDCWTCCLHLRPPPQHRSPPNKPKTEPDLKRQVEITVPTAVENTKLGSDSQGPRQSTYSSPFDFPNHTF
ncbi:hypothetical protein BJY04DRAFT_220490 [Aspergillus karnatakaensis]|uniref:uncharacterized protein n=1 Tax=Aspergillus karnatakaensis TaxID=1810916 RepID=UPI003CCD7D82